MKSLHTSFAAALNFSFSKSSLTKDLTTRIPLMFSCTDSLSLSYFLNTLTNTGLTTLIILKRPNPRIGTTTANIRDNFPPSFIDITNAKISINGHRTAILIIIIKANCTLFTSVVILVTRLEEENLSMFENEKSCIL